MTATPNNARSAKLQHLIKRRERVLAILHTPTAAHARIMEQAGCEAAFVGTSGVVGALHRPGRRRHRDHDGMRARSPVGLREA